MKTQTPLSDMTELENELAKIAPFVREGFHQSGGPSPRVEEAIRAEALRCAGKKHGRDRWPLYRTLAAAAAFALLLGGAIQLHLGRESGLRNEVTRSRPVTKNLPSVLPSESDAGLATLLLEIQGLNEEGFFRPEEAEPLWL